MENPDSYIPSHMENSSPGEKFAYKAELQKNFIENDTISFTDQFNAETEAKINGPKLDLNPSLTEADLIDSSPIKQAYLTGNYIEDGNLDHSDVFEADMQSSLNGSSSSFETNSIRVHNIFSNDCKPAIFLEISRSNSVLLSFSIISLLFRGFLLIFYSIFFNFFS